MQPTVHSFTSLVSAVTGQNATANLVSNSIAVNVLLQSLAARGVEINVFLTDNPGQNPEVARESGSSRYGIEIPVQAFDGETHLGVDGTEYATKFERILAHELFHVLQLELGLDISDPLATEGLAEEFANEAMFQAFKEVANQGTSSIEGSGSAPVFGDTSPNNGNGSNGGQDSNGDGRSDGQGDGGGGGGDGDGGGGPNPPTKPNDEGSQGSPLVFDLDGDGVELYAVGDYGTYFDLRGNGQSVLTGWVEPDDGLLALDVNGDGTINDITELFGSIDTDGFTELAVHDLNGDGVIDAGDAVFTDLLLWTDVNSDGVSQAAELHTLADYNIASISLNAERVAKVEIAGNDITHESSYTLNDGTERDVVDAWFTYDVNFTHNVDAYGVDLRALFLPTFRGFGNLKDFHQAISLDNGAGVETLMSQVTDLTGALTLTSAFSDLTALDDAMEDILLRWAGAEAIDPASRGSYVNAQHLAFNEAFRGEPFLQYGQPNPLPEAGEYSEAVYAYFKAFYTAQFITQTTGADIFVAPQYNLYTAGIEGDLTLVQSGIDAIEAAALDVSTDAALVWSRFAQFLGYTKGLGNLSASEITALDAAVVATNEPSLNDWQDVLNVMNLTLGSVIETSDDWGSFEIFYDNFTAGTSGDDTIIDNNAGGFTDNEFLGADGNDFIQGLDGHDKLRGGSGNDTLEGGIGDDYLLGGVGDDVYLYESGNDTISEEGGSGNDEIRIMASTSLTQANLTDFYRFGDELILFLDTGNYITIDGYNGTDTKIEKIVFESDGSEIDLTAIVQEKFYGTAGADKLVVSGDNFQTLLTFGFEGNDVIEANGAAAEFYGGDGYDTLIGDFQSDLLSGGAGDDYLLGFTGDDFLYGGDQDDTLKGEDGNDTLEGGKGNDILDGGAGDDILDGGGDGASDSQSGQNTFIFGRGYGNDTIIRTLLGDDKVVFTDDILTSDIEITRNTASTASRDDLTLKITDTQETLLVNDGFNWVSSFWAGNVQSFEFADGTIWSAQDVRDAYLLNNITAGDDITYAFDNDNVIASTAGNDQIYGLLGADSYFWGAGSGNDLLVEGTQFSSTVDQLTFENLNITDLTFSRSTNHDDLIVTNNATTETLTIAKQFVFASGVQQIELFSFADGTTWNGLDVQQHLISLLITAGDDVIEDFKGDNIFAASDGNDYIDGDEGDDTIYGGAGDDILIAGKGDDFLYGGTGNDLLVAAAGQDYFDGGTGIDTVDFTYASSGADIDLTLNQIDFGSSVESIISIENVIGTRGSNIITGDDGDNILDGFKGDDTLYGGLGNDTLLGGDNDDVIDGGGGIDTVSYENASFSVVIDLQAGTTANDGYNDTDTLISIENVKGSDNDDTIIGSSGDNVLEGWLNDDDLQGGAGNDGYIFNAGDDQDTITDTDGTNDFIRLGPGILETDLTLTDVGDDLEITFAGNPTDKITIIGQNGAGTTQIEKIVFDDFSELLLVIPPNTDPVANDDSVSTDEDVAVIINVLGNDTDADSGDILDVASVGAASNGTTTLNGDNTITYTPNANFNGGDSFTYDIDDGNGGTDTATVNVTVNPVNDGPVAADDSFVVNEDTALVGNVLADNGAGTDSDLDGDILSAVAGVIATVGGGTVNLLTDGGFTYTPALNFNGVDSFDYTVEDGNGGSDIGTASITVNPINDDPDAQDDNIATDEDVAVIIDVLANDTDADNDTLDVVSVGLATNGVAVLNADNTVTYTPNANFNGADSFTYDIDDGNGGTDTATVNITVNPVNDAPVLTNNGGSADEDTVLTLSVSMLDVADIDNTDSEIVFTLNSLPVNGALALSGSILAVSDTFTMQDITDGNMTFTPNADENGIFGFDFTVSDGSTTLPSEMFVMSINAVNDNPAAVDDSATTDEDVAVIIDVLANDSDIDLDTLSVASVGIASNGTIVINGDNTVTYTPNAGFSGADSFIYTTNDGNGGTDTGTVDVTVNAGSSTYNVITGTSANNTIYGSVDDDLISGLEGNDNLFGQAGDDLLKGGTGDDKLHGSTGLDAAIWDQDSDGFIVYRTTSSYLYVEDTNANGQGKDRVYTDVEEIQFNDITLDLTSMTFVSNGLGWGTAATVYGTSAGGTTNGTAAIDEIHAAGGNDYLYGRYGDDILHGDDGADRLYGNQGNDLLYGGAGDDWLDGDDGTDTAVWDQDSDGFIIYRTSSSYVFVEDTNANGQGKDRVYTDVEKIQFNDITLDLASMNLIVNGAGWGTAAPVYGTSAGGATNGTAASDIIYAAGGNDTIYASHGDDVLHGEDGNDIIQGQQGDDVLYGDDGNDKLYGNQGDDLLYGGAGDDWLDGDDGTDTAVWDQDSDGFIIYRTSSGYITAEDTNANGQGTDRVYNDVEYIQFNDVTLDLASMNLVLNGAAWGTTAPVYGTSAGGATYGTAANDIIYAAGGNDSIYGRYGDDILHGEDGNDIIQGEQGDDQIYGGAGNDSIYGNDGTDTAVWDQNSDGFIIYRGGSSYLYVEDTNDPVNGYGLDKVYSSVEYIQFNDVTLDLSSINLVLNGAAWGTAAPVYGTSAGGATNGTSASDIIYAAGGNDTIYGRYGDDVLYGEVGNDQIQGEQGDDQLYGGVGNDTLVGGDGADSFIFEAGKTFSYSDTITDFSTSEGDVIDISDVIIGYDPLTEAISDFVQITESGSHSYLAVDTDGGADNFVQIAQIKNITGLTDEEALETSGNLVTV